VCFLGNDRNKAFDHLDIDVALPIAIKDSINFIEQSSFKLSKFGKIHREDILQFPSKAVR
jgi:predicted HTH transcriptional regulator